MPNPPNDSAATTNRWAIALRALSRTTGGTARRDPADDECVIVMRSGEWVRYRLDATALRFVHGEFGERPV